MRNFYFLILNFLTVINLYGQNNLWYISADNITKTLTVDTDDGAEGSIGSWYKWEINNNANILGTQDDLDGPEQNDNNKAIITWNATFPTSYTENNTSELIKDYTVNATEFNNCDNIIGNTTTTDVKLVKLDILNIEMDSSICNENEATVTIYGTPDSEITLNITGGQLINTNLIKIGSNGKVDVSLKPINNSTEIIINIVEIKYIKQNPFNQEFSISKNNGFTYDTTNLKIPVGKSPVITPIMF